jgi:hypothetical protein
MAGPLVDYGAARFGYGGFLRQLGYMADSLVAAQVANMTGIAVPIEGRDAFIREEFAALNHAVMTLERNLLIGIRQRYAFLTQEVDRMDAETIQRMSREGKE